MRKQQLLARVIRCLVLVSWFIAGAVHATASIPMDVAENLRKGTSQDVLLVFDDTAVRDAAAALRKQLRVSTDTAAVQTLRAQHIAELKALAFAGIPPSSYQVLREYPHIAMRFVRFSDLQALLALASRPEIIGVFKDQTLRTQLAESLPLIGQPVVAASGDTGSGATVLVIDTGVNYTLSAFGGCSAPGVPAGCKVNFYQNIADSNTALDAYGHGTNVSGIVVGVAPSAKVAMMNVFGAASSTSTSLIIQAIDWGIANQAAYNILSMNLSLGDSTKNIAPCSNARTNPYVTPLSDAKTAGILPAVAAGNNAWIDGLTTLACPVAAVSVGAVYDANVGGLSYSACTDATSAPDQIACFSDSASFLTLLAPGAIVTAAGLSYAGTSQATPFIAGAAAVLRSAFHADTVDDTVSRMTSTGKFITDVRNGIVKPRLQLASAAVPANDNFLNRIALSGASGSVIGHNILATKESGEPNHAGNSGGASVWWKWLASGNGQVSVTTQGSSFDTLLGVYTGNAVAALTTIASNDNSGAADKSSSLVFQAVAGTEYQIAVDGYNAAAGDITLGWNLNTAATADISISGGASPSVVSQGDQVTYNLILNNAGPQAASNVKLLDTLPPGMSFLAASSGCSGSATITCMVPLLPAGSSTTLSIIAQAAATGSLVNSMNISSDLPDPQSGNNGISVAVNVQRTAQDSSYDIPTFPEWASIAFACLLSFSSWRTTARSRRRY